MFSKLQIYVLAGCALITAVIFAVYEVYEFRSGPLSRQTVTASSGPSADFPDNSASPNGGATSNATPPESKQTSPSIISQGNESDDRTIDALMEKIAGSFKAGDYTVAIDLMYTPLVESFGGREKAMGGAKVAAEEMKAQGMTMTSWQTKKPYTYLAGKSHKYAIIPYELKMTISGKTVNRSGYQLGIKTAASGWQFVSGDRLTPEIYDQFFPDFPKDVELPEVQQTSE